jgi:putative ABC transport system substrate-binding protein
MEANVDLIFCVTTPACLAAQRAIGETDVAVVFSAVTDPVAVGLVEDLTRPGGNLTGITVGAEDAINEGRRLDWLLKVAPRIESVYIPYNPDDAVSTVSLVAVQDVASTLGIELLLQEARTAEEVDAALNAIPEAADALFVFADQVVVADVAAVVNAALERDLPLSTPNSLGPQLGALMSYGSDLYTSGNQAARLADQILRGSDPDTLPVETPEFFLTLNLNTAEAIGLEISDQVLRQADTIIR